MDPSFRMKLACVRCKRKKIKCDRATPSCHQCVTAHADCQYVERRQRPRLAQQRVAVQNLNQRLEQLERQISHTNDSPPTSLASTSNIEISPVPSPKASLNATDGHESWVYQLANDTRRNFQIQATPEATPKGRIDDAMASLNEALDDLGKIRVRPDTIGADFTLSPEESKACIDAFFQLLASQVCPETFTDAVDFNLLYALPSIIQSPYINIEPGVHVLYYNALHFGIQQIRGPHDPLVRAAYLKIMEAVPAWLESSGDSEMDGHTASLTSWTALVNWDYQLSWKFHLKSCQHIKMKGIDHIDVVPARTFEEENKRDQHRILYWHVLSMDSLYRLFSGKPTVMRWVPNKVRPPALFRPTQLHPSAAQVITSAIWIRYTVMTAEMINYLDDEAAKKTDEVTCAKVHQFCLDLEALMDEFKMEAMMEDESNPIDFRGLIADHIMNVYSIIIGIKRLVNKTTQHHQVDEVTVRAARSVVCIIIAFSTDTKFDDKVKSIFDHFVTFYPFCAVFSLYEHVLACKDPDDCEDDIRSLEDIAEAMTHVSVHRRGFLPFAKTINAMNRVVRSFSEERRKSRPATAEGEGVYSSSEGGNIAASNLDTFQNIVASELDQFDPATMAQLPDFSMGADGDFHPFGFVRAVENDFQSRNWHENWWDINGTATENMTGLDENSNIQGAQFGFPTPSTT